MASSPRVTRAYAAVNIGSFRVSCMILGQDDNGALQVLGSSHRKSEGVKRGYLEQGDLSEAMSAAAVVGDDAIQKRYQGYVDPDTFNHGTSAQRQEWFKRGFEAGDLSGWDTFKGL